MNLIYSIEYGPALSPEYVEREKKKKERFKAEKRNLDAKIARVRKEVKTARDAKKLHDEKRALAPPVEMTKEERERLVGIGQKRDTIDRLLRLKRRLVEENAETLDEIDKAGKQEEIGREVATLLDKQRKEEAKIELGKKYGPSMLVTNYLTKKINEEEKRETRRREKRKNEKELRDLQASEIIAEVEELTGAGQKLTALDPDVARMIRKSTRE